MPIYEYECDACGHHVEALQKFSDPPLTECEACHSHKIKKVISQSTFHLKGTGWYVTDYASKSGSAAFSGGKEKGPDSATGASKTEAASSSENKNKKETPASSSGKE
jgi:putative FmdB family regulatory protein